MMLPGMKGSPIRVWHARGIEIGKTEKAGNHLTNDEKPDTLGEVAGSLSREKSFLLNGQRNGR
jgi:hypothetical protein